MKNKRLYDFIRVIFSNGMGLFLSLAITIILPIKLSVEGYGYWQLYYFYSSLVGLLMFGFSDGVNLRYAGIKYKDLNKELFRTYFRFVLFLSVTMFLLSLTMAFSLLENERLFAFIFISLNIVLFNINGFFLHVNQISLRFKYYSWAIILDRLIFVLSIAPILFLPVKDFKIFIIINILSRCVVILYNIVNSKEIVFGKSLPIRRSLSEISANFKVGIFLTTALGINMLLVGYPRFFIDAFLSIEDFAIYSFANSILSMTIQIVIAISTVLYPLLRRIDITKYETLNVLLEKSVIILCAVMLGTYFPIYIIINSYLSKYIPLLEYLFCLFPLMIYICKNNIVVSTFYKALRLEKRLLLNNIIGLVFGITITFSSFMIFNNIKSIVVTSVVCYALWNHYTEWQLIKKCNWANKNRFGDLVIVIGFLLISRIFTPAWGLLWYGLYLFIIGFLLRRTLKSWLSDILHLLGRKNLQN
ncbi:oligosaccharide flippase family protein [uncultured Rossellomorea sp.]|uniref:oligosaccharide flippase family protein n=1 Tax=uncultured Rossellomorea sp. TaxID=2837549 RepID=UPI00262CE434|nr:oligosaccharide flippase family protein [uncultured Rossellomorea sp.]